MPEKRRHTEPEIVRRRTWELHLVDPVIVSGRVWTIKEKLLNTRFVRGDRFSAMIKALQELEPAADKVRNAALEARPEDPFIEHDNEAVIAMLRKVRVIKRALSTLEHPPEVLKKHVEPLEAHLQGKEYRPTPKPLPQPQKKKRRWWQPE